LLLTHNALLGTTHAPHHQPQLPAGAAIDQNLSPHDSTWPTNAANQPWPLGCPCVLATSSLLLASHRATRPPHSCRNSWRRGRGCLPRAPYKSCSPPPPRPPLGERSYAAACFCGWNGWAAAAAAAAWARTKQGATITATTDAIPGGCATLRGMLEPWAGPPVALLPSLPLLLLLLLLLLLPLPVAIAPPWRLAWRQPCCWVRSPQGYHYCVQHLPGSTWRRNCGSPWAHQPPAAAAAVGVGLSGGVTLRTASCHAAHGSGAPWPQQLQTLPRLLLRRAGCCFEGTDAGCCCCCRCRCCCRRWHQRIACGWCGRRPAWSGGGWRWC
jgi:hypothetical protein